MERINKKGGETIIQNNINNEFDPTSQKNIESIMSLMGNKDVNSFRRVWDSFRIDIILPEEFEDDGAAVESCKIALNLLPRFIRFVKYQGPTSVLKDFPASHKLKINLASDDWNPKTSIIFGHQHKISRTNAIYVGSMGWSAYISREHVCPWENENQNRLSAIYAGALAVGEIFKEVISIKSPNLITHLEYDLISHNTSGLKHPIMEPKLPSKIFFHNTWLIGCGAIGQAIIYSLINSITLFGDISLVDNDVLDQSNEQRYLFAFEEYRGSNKAQLLASHILRTNPGLIPTLIPSKYENITNIEPPNIDEAISAVDNIKTRINIQACLPRIIWNVWTNTGVDLLEYGIGKHTLVGPYECLACAYYPIGPQITEIKMASIKTGIPEEEVQRRYYTNDLITENDIMRVATHNKINPIELRQTLGKPFINLLHGDCGVYRFKTEEDHAITPAPHVPLLAGILLTTQLILSRMELPIYAKPINSVAEFNALGIPNQNCIVNKFREPNCFCMDKDYQDAYKEKWKL